MIYILIDSMYRSKTQYTNVNLLVWILYTASLEIFIKYLNTNEQSNTSIYRNTLAKYFTLKIYDDRTHYSFNYLHSMYDMTRSAVDSERVHWHWRFTSCAIDNKTDRRCCEDGWLWIWPLKPTKYFIRDQSVRNCNV